MNQINLFIGLILFLAISGLYAQATVNSKTYSLMLRGLLSHSVTELSAEEAAKLEGKSIFLDAREAHEYDVSHIKDALFVGYDNFDLQPVLDKVSKDKKVIVYCSVGYRSEKISEQLLKAGYKDVSNLYGGIFEWKNSGYPVYKSKAETEEVHAYDRIWGVWLRKGKKIYRKP